MKRSSDLAGPDPLLGLTAKQCEVLDLLIEHQTSKEISRKLGISPHTVDQRIMLARAKLNVGSRSEVAQAYRRLVQARRETAPTPPPSPIYMESVYGSPGLAATATPGHSVWQEEAGPVSSGDCFSGTVTAASASQSMTQVQAIDPARSYYHVLPEAFDGQIGTLMRLGAIAAITAFLTLVILGGLAIYSELSHLVDG